MTELKARRPIGSRPNRQTVLVVAAAVGLILAVAGPGAAQVVVNPNKIQFESPDHDRLLPAGGYLIERYVLEIWLSGVNTSTGSPFQISDLGRPDRIPGTDVLSVDRSTFFVGLPVGQSYFATVKATGPGGDSRSGVSPGFLTVVPPAPPGDVTVVPPEVVLYAEDFVVSGPRWRIVSRSDAAGGRALDNANFGEPATDPVRSPASYAEAQFVASAGVPYHLWLRMEAAGDSQQNDSVSVQFSGAIDGTGSRIFAIGSDDAATVILQEGRRARFRGWGWNDQEYGFTAGPIYFNSSGLQTVRIQQREDGVTLDQVVLSPAKYLTSPPGSFTNCTVIVPKQ